MSLEGFNILVGFSYAFAWLWFNPPSHSDSPLVLRVGNGCRDTVSPIQPCMYAMTLLIWIKVRGGQARQYEVQLIHIQFNGSVNNRVDIAITGRLNILEGNVLIKGFGEFILCPLWRK